MEYIISTPERHGCNWSIVLEFLTLVSYEKGLHGLAFEVDRSMFKLFL